MRRPRGETVDPQKVQTLYVRNETVQQFVLFGNDPHTGEDRSHRKRWVQQRLGQLSQQLAMDLLAFSIGANEIHLMVRSRPDRLETWDDRQVAHRWLTLCPGEQKKYGPRGGTFQERVDALSGDPEECRKIRLRFSDVSWFVRLLCQPLASRCNRESKCRGHVFASRFRGVELTDVASVLACSAYVDLRAVARGECRWVEDSPFTSIAHRIEAQRNAVRDQADVHLNAVPPDDATSDLPSLERTAEQILAQTNLLQAKREDAVSDRADNRGVDQVSSEPNEGTLANEGTTANAATPRTGLPPSDPVHDGPPVRPIRPSDFLRTSFKMALATKNRYSSSGLTTFHGRSYSDAMHGVSQQSF